MSRPPSPRDLELAAARHVCLLVKQLLGSRPGQVHWQTLPELVDAYEDWRTMAGQKGAWGIVRPRPR